ncbi:hypothetical protein WJX84_009866 [Apatococcus fuscideae]|uniref:Uncharacterized protein n=1 Tax=Apatococcus fuscideae TaxID=2026836 RepID=A0AAW1T8I2_9CHLO
MSPRHERDREKDCCRGAHTVDHQAWYLPYLRWSLHQGPSFKHRMKKKSLVATPTGSNSSEETTSKEAQSFWVSVFSSSILRT